MPRKRRKLHAFTQVLGVEALESVDRQLRAIRRLVLEDIIFRDEGDGVTLQLSDGHESLWVKFTITPFKQENRKVVNAITMEVEDGSVFDVGAYNRTVYESERSSEEETQNPGTSRTCTR